MRKLTKGVTVAGRESFSLKGYGELTHLVRTIAARRNLTVPEVLDMALPVLRRAHEQDIRKEMARLTKQEN